MLVYVSSGPRRFGDRPLPVQARDRWEFFAILRGRMAPLFDPDRPAVAPAGGTLWIFPPGHRHGWQGEPRQTAQVAVFHFNRLPASLLARLGESSRGHSFPLTPAMTRQLARHARHLQTEFWRGSGDPEIRGDWAALEIGLLLFGHDDAAHVSATPRADAVERWFLENLHLHPDVEAVACRLGVTPAQVRRIFQAERGESPRRALERLRLEAARQHLRETDLKLEAVAALSGYHSASVLVQAFRRAEGLTPAEWRVKIRQNRAAAAPMRDIHMRAH